MAETAILEELSVPAGRLNLPGEFEMPKNAASLVIFSHGSGSSRLSPRNQYVARSLREKGISTFLFDLLAEEEDKVSSRFDIDLLTNRLVDATIWILAQPFARGLVPGYFGASTGAASALNAAARLGSKIRAVVSRGGRPDLAMPMLPQVKAATLLVVGSLDHDVLQLNKVAFDELDTTKEFRIVSGAGHLFEEPGKLEEVSQYAADWFSSYLVETV